MKLDLLVVGSFSHEQTLVSYGTEDASSPELSVVSASLGLRMLREGCDFPSKVRITCYWGILISRIFLKRVLLSVPQKHISGCSIMVVYAVWDRVARVRFPAPRQIETAPDYSGAVSIFARESKTAAMPEASEVGSTVLMF